MPKNDLMFLQNEILGDIKKVENKLESKIFKLSESLDDQKSTYEKKYNHLEALFNILKQKTQNLKLNDSSEKETTTKINSLDKKIDQYYSRLESKIILLQNNLQDSNYKIDKVILNSNQVPGLIGDRCPYSSMRDFCENIHKKISESLRHKEQQSMDLKKYKEKMDAVITKNNTQLPLFENKITNYFDLQIRDIDNKYKERIDIIEERMNGLRIENGNYSTNLIEKCNELNEKYENIDKAIKNSIEKYNEEITEYINSFKNMNNNIKHFEEKYNLFQEKFNMLNKLDNNVKQIKNNFNKLDNTITEINNKIITSKKEESDFEENKNKSIIINKNNNNNIIYKLQNEEMEINSLINSKQNKNKEGISLKKLNIKNNNISVGRRKINYKANYLDLVKNYQKKKENFFDESYEYTKINNIIFDADFFRRSNYLGNSYSNDYYNQNYRIKRPQKLLYRIKSCKNANQLNHLSINENNMNDEQSNLNINNNINNENHNSLDNYLFDKEDYDNRKELLITSNLRKKYDLESSETYYPPSHKFLYLDKKIDILSNVMVDSINKLIYQINYLKKQNLNINSSEGKENTNNSPAKKRQFFRSPSYIGKSNFKKVYSEKRRKLSQRFNIVSKDNDNKKVVN